MAGTVWMETHPLQAGQTAPSVAYNIIDEAHLSTMRIALATGRGFTEADGKSTPLVAIVNRTMAQRFWPGEDPIGKRFSLRGAAGPFLEIVGMTGDGQYRFFSPEPQAYFYVPLAQNYSSARAVEIRSTVPPESLIPAVEAEVHKLSRDLPIINIATMEQVSHGFAGLLLPEIAAELSGLLGLVGLGLAVIGIYGVIAFGVQQRARELAIRMALGARPLDVLRLVAGQGLRLVLAGIAAGLAAALLAGRGAAKLLIGVSSTDPATYATVATILGSVALLACYIPARYAARANASDALRSE
jgi:predicted permease